MGTGAMLLVCDGVIVAAWGDVDGRFACRSVRKSLLGAIVGVHVDSGRLSLNDTLADLGIDDLSPLTEVERSATVRDLLMSRSGVYLPAAMESSSAARSRPTRGSDRPGGRWWYNNWGFNALGTIVEHVDARTVFDQFDQFIATPLGMEDFGPGSVVDVLEPRNSMHRAAEFLMSARDLARFGQLYLDEGVWEGKRLLSRAWVAASVEAHTDFDGGGGYGYLWMTYPGLGSDGVQHFAAQGTGGQFIYVAPDLRAVVVHLRDMSESTPAPEQEHEVVAMIRDLLRARVGGPSSDAALVATRPEPLLGSAPSARPLAACPLDLIDRLAGVYQSADGGLTLELFRHEGRLFAAPSATHRQFELLFDPATGTLRAPADPIVVRPSPDGRSIDIEAFGVRLIVRR